MILTFVLVGVMIVLGVLGLARTVPQSVGLAVLLFMILLALVLTVRSYRQVKRREE